MTTLEKRIDQAERGIGALTPSAEPRLELFAINFTQYAAASPILERWREWYYWVTAPERYSGNYRAEHLDDLQSSGAEVCLWFDPADWDFVFRTWDWEFPKYQPEHFIAWRDYTPGDCLARARALAALEHAPAKG